jgi:hypothetical protein
VCDKVSCTRVRVAQPAGSPGGIGTGRDYGSTDEAAAATAAFLSARKAEQQALRSGNPDACGCSSGASRQALADPARWSVPGGGNPTSLMVCQK